MLNETFSVIFKHRVFALLSQHFYHLLTYEEK